MEGFEEPQKRERKGFKERLREEVDAKVEKKERKKQLTPEQRSRLKELYYSPRDGYGNVRKVFENAKKSNLGVTYQQVQNFMEDQYVVQANKPSKKPKYWNSIAAPGPGYNYQMDLIDYTRYKIDGFGWILVIIDVHSRKAGARAIKAEYTRQGRKSPYAKVWWESYLKYYKDIIEEDFDGRYPKDLNCDNEFIEKGFVDFVTSKGTKIHYSDPKDYNKNAIVERFNRTLELLLQKIRFSTDDIRWPLYLQDAIHNYNNSYHRTIKTEPEKVWRGEEKSKQQITWLWNTLKEGDQVRIKKNLNVFAKGDALRYSTDIYLTIKRNGSRWLLRNIRTGKEDDNHGRWYKENQLQKVNKIVKPSKAADGAEKEAELYGENEEGELPSEYHKEEREKEKENEREDEYDEESDGTEGVSDKGVSHVNAIKQLSLNRRLKKFSKNVNEQPHEEVEEDPDRPGHVRYVIPERLKPKTSRAERRVGAKRRLEEPPNRNRAKERKERRKRRKKSK